MLSKESIPKVSKKEMVSKGISDEKPLRKTTFNDGRCDEVEVLFFSSEHFERRQVYGTKRSEWLLFITK